MTLPLAPPVPPQLARPARDLPTGEGWWYEPKWDGFRAIVFVDGDEVLLQSRNGRPLGRYFPELTPPAGRYVLDGEIVVPTGSGVDFEALQQRIHPADSRVRMLADRTPALIMAFDLLARGDEVLIGRPFAERRALLHALVEDGPVLRLTPGTSSPGDAGVWLREAEGVIAKEEGAPYLPGERVGMRKIRRERTIDCVVMGWRPGKNGGDEAVASLILGLYEPGGMLRPVGHASGFRAARRRELRELVRPHETGARGSGEASRWTAGRDLEWVALRPALVVEVAFDHVSGGRIRHGARLVRVREDRDPESCSADQLEA